MTKSIPVFHLSNLFSNIIPEISRNICFHFFICRYVKEFSIFPIKLGCFSFLLAWWNQSLKRLPTVLHYLNETSLLSNRILYVPNFRKWQTFQVPKEWQVKNLWKKKKGDNVGMQGNLLRCIVNWSGVEELSGVVWSAG